MIALANAIPRYPVRMSPQEFYPLAWRACYLGRRLDETISELFRKGYVKGTVTLGTGNEAVGTAMGMLFRPGQDILSILHRDILVHLLHGLPMTTLLCQYMANAKSPTHAREGNVHHGNVPQRRFPMISHLGNMLAPAVGAVWSARQAGEDVVGVGVIGDGGTSTGDFHESLNIAAVRRVPVLFLVENNEYAFSTPPHLQYRCSNLSDRAVGYGIAGTTVDGTDAWAVYTAIADAIDTMRSGEQPYLLECRTLRLDGHAVYDQAHYVTEEQKQIWRERDPFKRCLDDYRACCNPDPATLENDQQTIDTAIDAAVKEALAVGRPDPAKKPFIIYAPRQETSLPKFNGENLRCFQAVAQAQRYLLEREPRAFVLGQDIGPYESAFKTCKGLFEQFGTHRILDMPIAESATVGFALGASQVGGKPIMEFQFADFATEAVTQIGLNCATWFFRSDNPAPLLFRLPCGGGITLGAFHSGEFEGLWSRFPGLKILYPSTPQEFFEALVAGFYDPNPVLVMENKGLYTRVKGNVTFDGNTENVWRTRIVQQGTAVTVVAWGAMLELCQEALARTGIEGDLINPFVLHPLSIEPIVASVRKTGKLLVVQESGATAGMGDKIISLVTRKAFDALVCAPVLVASPDMPVPFAPELETLYRPDTGKVTEALSHLAGVARA